MNRTELQQKADNYWSGIRFSYGAAKELLIQSEEKLTEMQLYPAPLLEHRDALDHIMRYSQIVANEGLCESAINELASANQHEIRAFYDIADFICITIRKEIAETLGWLSERQIDEVWPNYKELRSRVISLSDEIAQIRNGTRETVSSIPRYQAAVAEMFQIYAFFQTDIQPKLGHSLLYRIYRFFKWYKANIA